MIFKGKNYFTSVEVLIALAVLSLGILAGTSLLSSARDRCRIAEATWMEQHAITQAAEYFLLAGTEQDIPVRFFPFSEYRISVFLANPVNLPPDVPDRKSGWRLATMHLKLFDANNILVREMSIDRIVRTGEK